MINDEPPISQLFVFTAFTASLPRNVSLSREYISRIDHMPGVGLGEFADVDDYSRLADHW
jgi:hypothetical protein